jgi:hypothetical protein
VVVKRKIVAHVESRQSVETDRVYKRTTNTTVIEAREEYTDSDGHESDNDATEKIKGRWEEQ